VIASARARCSSNAEIAYVKFHPMQLTPPKMTSKKAMTTMREYLSLFVLGKGTCGEVVVTVLDVVIPKTAVKTKETRKRRTKNRSSHGGDGKQKNEESWEKEKLTGNESYIRSPT